MRRSYIARQNNSKWNPISKVTLCTVKYAKKNSRKILSKMKQKYDLVNEDVCFSCRQYINYTILFVYLIVYKHLMKFEHKYSNFFHS